LGVLRKIWKISQVRKYYQHRKFTLHEKGNPRKLLLPSGKKDVFTLKKLKKLKTDNARKQLKKRQDIFKIVWCIENENINIQYNFHVSTVLFFGITTI